MKLQTIKLSNANIKYICELFSKQITKPGLTAEYSFLIAKNLEKLTTAYTSITKELYDEAADAAFNKIVADKNMLIEKYADRDENGVIIVNGENVQITTNLNEYNAALQQLIENSTDVITAHDEKVNASLKKLSELCEVEVYVMDVSKFPSNIEPIVVGSFATIE